jgi:hypothetical protein
MTKTIEAEVTEDSLEYLQEWADAVGCEVKDVAGDSIDSYLELEPEEL